MNVKIVKNLQRWTIKTSIALTWTQMHEVIGTNIEKPSAKSIFCSLFPWENRTSFMRKVSTSYEGQCCKICWFLAFSEFFKLSSFKFFRSELCLPSFATFPKNLLTSWVDDLCHFFVNAEFCSTDQGNPFKQGPCSRNGISIYLSIIINEWYHFWSHWWSGLSFRDGCKVFWMFLKEIFCHHFQRLQFPKTVFVHIP